MNLKLQIFCFLWAFAHLAHILRKVSETEPIAWLFLLATVLVLSKPGSIKRLMILCSVQVVFLFDQMPRADNHLYLMGFVNLAILAVLLVNWIKYKEIKIEHLSSGVPAIGLIILISYFAAAIAKLNHDFFDTSVSCAVSMYYDSLRWVPFSLPAWIEPFMPSFVAFTELLIPILIFFNRTRIYGIITVVIFHFLMSFSPTATALDFTIILYALVFLFIPSQAVNTVVAFGREKLSKHKLIARKEDLIICSIFIIVLLFISNRGDLMGYRNWFFLITSVAVFLGFYYFLILESLKQKKSENIPFRKIPYFTYPLFILLFFNIASPYIGFKTAGSFTMYSNLQVSENSYNHIIIPRVPIFNFMDDMVEVEEAEHGFLRIYANSDDLITYVDFVNYANRNPNQYVTFTRQGQQYENILISQYLESHKQSWVTSKFVQFRGYNPEDRSCRW